MAGLAGGTWVYQEVTESGEYSKEVVPTESGVHRHQAIAPASGEVDNRIWISPTQWVTRVEAADGDCAKEDKYLDRYSPYGYTLISDFLVNSGVGKVWVASMDYAPGLPACNEQ